ncbi:hypothetical protein ES708_22673 [subsurface metagenome]
MLTTGVLSIISFFNAKTDIYKSGISSNQVLFNETISLMKAIISLGVICSLQIPKILRIVCLSSFSFLAKASSKNSLNVFFQSVTIGGATR